MPQIYDCGKEVCTLLLDKTLLAIWAITDSYITNTKLNQSVILMIFLKCISEHMDLVFMNGFT